MGPIQVSGHHDSVKMTFLKRPVFLLQIDTSGFNTIMAQPAQRRLVTICRHNLKPLPGQPQGVTPRSTGKIENAPPSGNPGAMHTNPG